MTRANSPPDGVDAAMALVCNLPPVDRAGRRVTVQYLLDHATGRTAQDDGVVLDFAGDDDTARALLDFVLGERQCCPQFAYELGFAPDHTRVTLRLRANGVHVTPLQTMYGASTTV